MRMITRRVVATSVVALGVPVALVAIPAADALPTPPPQVSVAWHFDALDPNGRVVDVSGHQRTPTLAGRWSAVSGASGTGAARFETQSYATAAERGPTSGTREIAVAAVLRSLVPRPTGDHPNVLQHGRFADRSQVKMQITQDGTGRASCRFAGSRNAVVVTGPSTDVSDGRWHVVTCWRRGATVGVTVDGVVWAIGDGARTAATSYAEALARN